MRFRAHLSRREPLPPGWRAFGQLWDWPPEALTTVWHAFTESTDSAVRAFIYQIERLGERPTDERTRYLLDCQLSPAALVEMLEACVAERTLSRAVATAFEERIFHCVTASGTWKEAPGTQTPAGAAHA